VNLAGLHEASGYYLVLEWLREPASVKKTARTLLKRLPNDTDLYNIYALCEWSNKNTKVADNVFSSATRLGSVSYAALQLSPPLTSRAGRFGIIITNPSLDQLGMDGDGREP
jgi:hypothetical protein